MLDEVRHLQNSVVCDLVSLIDRKDNIVVKAPTGSGKTYMMADFMDRILSARQNVIFIVSSLSKAELAKQNYEAFVRYIDDGQFPHLNPYLITSDSSAEGSLFIPTDYNVYVLPRDLYKDNSRLKDGSSLINFLCECRFVSCSRIYIIKDECHIATSNLDELREHYFDKVINFSATPKLSRGQYPDIEIGETDAVNAHLIKRVEMGDDDDTLEDALDKFIEVKKAYLDNAINVNPCMIIQISNKDKAEEEIENIKTLLNSAGYSSLKWMLILDKNSDTAKGSDTNDILGAKKLPLSKWKQYAKADTSSIDIIIFKQVITEGWDIRRACMLYQIRDSKSKQLDEQVIGRVRRNPRLIDFETLDKTSRELVSTAYIWGVKRGNENMAQQTFLFGSETNNEIRQEMKIKTTRLKAFETSSAIDIEQLPLQSSDELTPRSIFDLYREVKKSSAEVQAIYMEYADSYERFFRFSGNISVIKNEINDYCCDYSENMIVTTDENNDVTEVSFPYRSSYTKTGIDKDIDDWVWRQDGNENEFCFDSESEREWLKKLLRLKKDHLIKTIRVDDEDIMLLGKNFLENSEIKYEYYSCGRYFSYPDFVMKDFRDRIHVFEVKSLNVSGTQSIDSEEYKAKVKSLKDFYAAVSKITHHFYYLPIKKGNDWTVWVMADGKTENKTFDDFVKFISE